MEPRIHLNQRIEELQQQLQKMAVMVEEAITKALKALEEQNSALAQQVISADTEIDKMEQLIEDQCVKIIATEQPVAGSLRELITIAKIVSNLERIGDHARHFANALMTVRYKLLKSVLPQIKEMAAIGTGMLTESLVAFTDGDVQQCRDIAGRDDQIDALHKKLYDDILDMMRNEPAFLEDGYTLLVLNRFLERMGDHITNICEWLCFAKTGEHYELNK